MESAEHKRWEIACAQLIFNILPGALARFGIICARGAVVLKNSSVE